MRSRTIALLLGCVIVLVACASVPRTLSPVPDSVPEDPSNYPPDAVLVADALLTELQRKRPRNVVFSDQADASLAQEGFRFSGFSVTAHRLLRYDDSSGPGTRTAQGSLVLMDQYGRVGALLYDTVYSLDGDRLLVKEAFLAPLYRKDVSIKAFLIPKAKVPPLQETWSESWDAMRRLDVMPEGGLRTGHLLGSHALVLFVMERMPEGADLKIDIALSDQMATLPPLTLPPDLCRDYDGWRVAIAIASPGDAAEAYRKDNSATLVDNTVTNFMK